MEGVKNVVSQESILKIGLSELFMNYLNKGVSSKIPLFVNHTKLSKAAIKMLIGKAAELFSELKMAAIIQSK